MSDLRRIGEFENVGIFIVLRRKTGPGDVLTMKAGCKHTIAAVTELKLIEVQLGKEISVKDKIKY